MDYFVQNWGTEGVAGFWTPVGAYKEKKQPHFLYFQCVVWIVDVALHPVQSLAGFPGSWQEALREPSEEAARKFPPSPLSTEKKWSKVARSAARA